MSGSSSTEQTLHHPRLGPIRGVKADNNFIQYRGIPYARIPRRFARSTLLDKLPASTDTVNDQVFDATKFGPSSVQPFGAAKTDAEGLELPTDGIDEKEGDYQDEFGCLNVTVTVPLGVHGKAPQGLPVLLFLHGGAYFFGAHSRSYYNPLTFLQQALDTGKPIIVVGANYRLGALGFLHSPEARTEGDVDVGDLMIPANNGLHDQLRLFEWVKANINGFGGDASNITAIGQSAGAESIILHQLLAKHAHDPPFARSITFSGSPVCMPAFTPEEHEKNFREQADKGGVAVEGKSSGEVAEELMKLDVGKIRDIGWVGAPCSQSEMMPYQTPSMALLRDPEGKQGSDGVELWQKEQIISTAGYDGGISFTMLMKNEERKDYGKAFIGIARDVLKTKQSSELLDIYGITEDSKDRDALLAICQFESDVGFFSPAVCEAMSASIDSSNKVYLQLFEHGNPFATSLEKNKYATHTWDICGLFGAFEDRLDAKDKDVIGDWRQKIIGFVGGEGGGELWKPYTVADGNALLVDRAGLTRQTREEYMDERSRRGRLWALADRIDKKHGLDILWNDLCRRFLMKGR